MSNEMTQTFEQMAAAALSEKFGCEIQEMAMDYTGTDEYGNSVHVQLLPKREYFSWYGRDQAEMNHNWPEDEGEHF